MDNFSILKINMIDQTYISNEIKSAFEKFKQHFKNSHELIEDYKKSKQFIKYEVKFIPRNKMQSTYILTFIFQKINTYYIISKFNFVIGINGGIIEYSFDQYNEIIDKINDVIKDNIYDLKIDIEKEDYDKLMNTLSIKHKKNLLAVLDENRNRSLKLLIFFFGLSFTNLKSEFDFRFNADFSEEEKNYIIQLYNKYYPCN